MAFNEPLPAFGNANEVVGVATDVVALPDGRGKGVLIQLDKTIPSKKVMVPYASVEWVRTSNQTNNDQPSKVVLPFSKEELLAKPQWSLDPQ